MRRIQGLVCRRLVICRERKLDDLRAAWFRQVEKDGGVKNSALVLAFLAENAQIDTTNPYFGWIAEERDEKRPSLLLHLNLAAIGPSTWAGS